MTRGAAVRMCTALDIAALDENSEHIGVPRRLLMENAGAAVARTVKRMFPRARRVLVVCGLGNNGGDGFVAARHLSRHARVIVDLIGDEDGIRTGEARENFSVLKRMRASVEIHTRVDAGTVRSHIEWADVVVDAILGTGVRGRLREPIRSIVEAMNSAGKPVVAVDCPTGLDPTTGRICGAAVRAAVTVTFHGYKAGFLGNEEYVGEVVVEDIGIPAEAESMVGPGDLLALKSLAPLAARIRLWSSGPGPLEECIRLLSGIGVELGVVERPEAADAVFLANASALDDPGGRAARELLRVKGVFCKSVDEALDAVEALGQCCCYVTGASGGPEDAARLAREVLGASSAYPLSLIVGDRVYVACRGWVKEGRLGGIDPRAWAASATAAFAALGDGLYSHTGLLWLCGGGGASRG